MTRERALRIPQDERKLEIIRATYRCLGKLGAAGTSMRSVAMESDVTVGLVTYHFGTKTQLFIETYQYLSDEFWEATTKELEAADHAPDQQLLAFLRVGFTERFLNREYVMARFALWEFAVTDANIRKAHDEIQARYRKQLAKIIDSIGIPGNRQEYLVFMLSSLLDGLWLEWCIGDAADYPNPEAVIQTCQELVMGSIR
jgi:TetR/AcrR family transcriptional repressor of bet genes